MAGCHGSITVGQGLTLQGLNDMQSSGRLLVTCTASSFPTMHAMRFGQLPVCEGLYQAMQRRNLPPTMPSHAETHLTLRHAMSCRESIFLTGSGSRSPTSTASILPGRSPYPSSRLSSRLRDLPPRVSTVWPHSPRCSHLLSFTRKCKEVAYTTSTQFILLPLDPTQCGTRPS